MWLSCLSSSHWAHGYLVFDGINHNVLEKYRSGINGHHYATGISPRFKETRHAVVLDNEGCIAHDSHPSRDGVYGRLEVLLFRPLKQEESPCPSSGNATKTP